jgi:hypothetical protein
MLAEDYEKQGYVVLFLFAEFMNDRKLDYVIHALMQHNATHCANYDDLRLVFSSHAVFTDRKELCLIGKRNTRDARGRLPAI